MARRKLVLPKTAGTCVDKLYQLREEKKQAQKAVTAIDDDFKTLLEHTKKLLKKAKAEGTVGKVARMQINKSEVPILKDMDRLKAFAKRTKSPDLISESMSTAAIKQRWDDGKEVPGVEHMVIEKVSITKKK